MDDLKFLARVKEKIERLTGEAIDLALDEAGDRLRVDLATRPPKVTLGAAMLEYPGLARMGIEYAVTSIHTHPTRAYGPSRWAGREVGPWSFRRSCGGTRGPLRNRRFRGASRAGSGGRSR